jgi:hypothetical protein
MVMWTWLTQHPLAVARFGNVLSFGLGVLVTWLFSRDARKKARFDLAESKRQAFDRSIGQFLLAKSLFYRQQAGSNRVPFFEDEMRDWVREEESLRLHAALHWLKTEGRAKTSAPGLWTFD